MINEVIISSDDIETKKTLLKDKKIKFFKRTTDLTIRSRPVIDSLEKILNKCDKKLKGITVIWPIQCPQIKLETVQEAINSLILNDADSCIVVNEVTNPIFQRQETGLRQLNNKGFLISDFDKLYLDTRSLIVIKNSNLSTGSLLGSKIVGINTLDDETIYIDSITKLNFVRYLNLNKNV